MAQDRTVRSCSVQRLNLELTTGCDHRCAHCYNVWGDAEAAYPRGQLPTDAYLQMVRKAVAQSGASQLTITGGEPLLHRDALQIIETACTLVPAVQLITNGSHVTGDTVRRLAQAGVKAVQLTLLAADRELHDRLKGTASFDATLRALLDLRDAGTAVQICFVATRANWMCFEEVLQLCFALGVRSLVYNRMSPAGGAIEQIQALLPAAAQVEANLEVAERLGRQWQIGVATAMPIPPCIIRIDRYSWVRFGFCSTGSSSPNLVVDPVGNVRACNLSRPLLGNLLDDDWSTIARHPYVQTFARTLPAACRGCAYERSCQGGCKESAAGTFGSLEHLEPFVHQVRSPSWRQAASRSPSPAAASSTQRPDRSR